MARAAKLVFPTDNWSVQNNWQPGPYGSPLQLLVQFCPDQQRSPAMAHYTDRLGEIGGIVKLIEEWEAQA
jgi:hypothetical protein